MEQKQPKPKKKGFLSSIFPDNRSFDSTIIAIALCFIFYMTVKKMLELDKDGSELITIFQGVKELVQMVVVGLFTKKVMEDKNGNNNGETQ